MKWYHALFVVMTLALVAPPSFGQQLSKDEKKEWKKKAKEYRKNPAQLKQLTEERDQYKMEAQQAMAQLNTMQANQQQFQAQLAQVQQENKQLKQQLMTAEQTINQLQQANMPPQPSDPGPVNPAPPEEDYSRGVVYRVQVGAYSIGKIPGKVQNIPDMRVEDAGNIQKVVIGNYRDFNDAKARQSELKRQGFSSAWIVAYKNDMRVSLKEARGY
jgi:multidrug efflux pump subunit AcrA (membrane-fusion protein)